MRARYYNPAIGRFISEDTYWGEAADPLSLNLYVYCANNPIIFVDPSGHTVVGISASAEAAFVLGVYGEISVYVDDDLNIMIAATAGGKFATNVSAQVGVGFTINGMDNVNDLTGWGMKTGLTIGEGLAVSGALAVNMDTADMGLDAGSSGSVNLYGGLIPGEYFIKIGKTWSLKQFNLLDELFNEHGYFSIEIFDMKIELLSKNGQLHIYGLLENKEVIYDFTNENEFNILINDLVRNGDEYDKYSNESFIE